LELPVFFGFGNLGLVENASDLDIVLFVEFFSADVKEIGNWPFRIGGIKRKIETECIFAYELTLKL
jgi:hypothetical protein